jgi:hypothetical protein
VSSVLWGTGLVLIYWSAVSAYSARVLAICFVCITDFRVVDSAL